MMVWVYRGIYPHPSDHTHLHNPQEGMKCIAPVLLIAVMSLAVFTQSATILKDAQLYYIHVQLVYYTCTPHIIMYTVYKFI